METKKNGVQAEAHTKEQTSGGHAHSHTHVLEDGTVVTHTHTHSHEHTKAVLNRLPCNRTPGVHQENGGERQRLQRSADPAFRSQSGDQQYRKSHSSGSHPALPGRCDRVRR